MPTVVVGYVPKPEGDAAVRAAVAEARLRGAGLVVVSSQRGGEDPDAAGTAERDLGAVRELLEQSGVAYEVRQLGQGLEPAEDLLSIAESTHAELIVIGLRRRSPVGKLILGSNAQRILLDAHCPVLAVKAR